MSLISQDAYSGGISFGAVGMGDTGGSGNGFHFDLPLASVAAFSQQALDFSSDASRARLGFFNNVNNTATNAVGYVSAGVENKLSQDQNVLGNISQAFSNGMANLPPPVATPVIAPPPIVSSVLNPPALSVAPSVQAPVAFAPVSAPVISSPLMAANTPTIDATPAPVPQPTGFGNVIRAIQQGITNFIGGGDPNNALNQYASSVDAYSPGQA